MVIHYKIKKALEYIKYSKAFSAGDERIELPPKVLETPIIPFDQSPTKRNSDRVNVR